MPTSLALAAQIEQRLLARNQVLESVFQQGSPPLGGSLPRNVRSDFCAAAGCWPLGAGRTRRTPSTSPWNSCIRSSSESAPFPALDLSLAFEPWLKALVQADDIVMGFGPPEGDPEVWTALRCSPHNAAR